MIRCIAVVFGIVILLSFCTLASCHEGDVWQISIPSAKTKLSEYAAAMTPDGRYIVMGMRELTGWTEVYVLDRLTGDHDLVTIDSDGNQAFGEHSGSRSISGDGRFVAFSTAATIDPDNVNGYSQVYVRDRLLRCTQLITQSASGDVYAYDSNGEAISDDGMYVAYRSRVPIIVDGETVSWRRIYRYDRVTGQRTLESAASDGSAANEEVSDFSMSADGRCIAFSSGATNLVPEGSNGRLFVYLRDCVSRQTTRIVGDYTNHLFIYPLISADGSTIVFSALPADRYGHPTDSRPALFAYEREAGVLSSFVITGSGGQVDQLQVTSVSGDGRYVIFVSDADGIVTGDNDGGSDVFEFDRVTHEVRSISTPGQSDAFGGIISADGRYAAFSTQATDSDYPMQAFIRQMLPGDEEVTAPAEWFNPGWNWFSIPLDPAGWPDPSNLLGLNVQNRVFRFNPVGKWWELYPNDVHYLVRGQGYLLWLDRPIEPSYDGLEPDGDFEIPLPEAGWTWIGCPYNHPVPIAELRIRDESTGSIRTATEDTTAPDPWVNWNLVWWESPVDTWRISSLSGQDNDSLYPWRGYLVWSNTRDTTLLVPGP